MQNVQATEREAEKHPERRRPVLLYLVTEDWSFLSHRLPMARAARDAGFDVVVAARVTKDRAAIEAEGFRVESLPWQRGGINPLRELREVWRIRSLLRKIKPDLVHHVALKPVIHGGLAAWAASVPGTVNALTGLGFVFIGNSVKARILRLVIVPLLRWLLNRPGAFLLMQNSDDIETLRQRGILRPQTPVSLIRGSGVDIKRFAPSPEPPLIPVPGHPAGDVMEAALVARMLRDKGIEEAIEAARILRERGVPLRLRLVGPVDPENGAAIPEAEIQARVADGLVVWDGPRKDIDALWRDTAIAVLPSYREGLPKALLEAAAAGRPMVATDVPGCREICREGESGLLVPVRDAAALARALETLAMDADLRRTLGNGARTMAENCFSEEIIARDIVALYHQVLNAHSPARTRT